MSILDEIARGGYYLYSPKEWGKTDTELKELVNLGIISKLADELNNSDYNNCYYYVAKGNPLGINWQDEGNGYLRLQPRKC